VGSLLLLPLLVLINKILKKEKSQQTYCVAASVLVLESVSEIMVKRPGNCDPDRQAVPLQSTLTHVQKENAEMSKVIFFS